jgi:hypothetical protein
LFFSLSLSLNIKPGNERPGIGFDASDHCRSLIQAKKEKGNQSLKEKKLNGAGARSAIKKSRR